MTRYKGNFICVEYSSRSPRAECWKAYDLIDTAYDDNKDGAIEKLKVKIDQRLDCKIQQK